MLERIIFFFLLLYCLEILLVLAGHLKRIRRFGPPGSKTISIVVAARNEEKHLPLCLPSLFAQVYPALEVIVVDDRSTDRTAQILLQEQSRHANLRVIRIAENKSNLTGKQNALHQGILAATGEIILSTDADCVADPQWAGEMAAFLKAGNHFVFGVTEIKPLDSFFKKFQAFELNVLFKFAVGIAKLGKAGSCMGNNIGFFKKDYLMIGGFPAMGYRTAEDFALMHAMKRANLRIGALEKALIASSAVESLSEWFHQRMRWLGGSLSARQWMFWSLLPFIFANTATPIFLLAGQAGNWLVALFALKIFLDFILIIFRTPKTLLTLSPLLFLYGLAGTPAYLLLYLFKRKIVWKYDPLPLRR